MFCPCGADSRGQPLLKGRGSAIVAGNRGIKFLPMHGLYAMATEPNPNDGTDEMDTVQWRNELRDRLAEHATWEPDSAEEAFLKAALEEVADHLANKHMEYDSGGTVSTGATAMNYEAVADLLEDNVRDVDVRTNGSFAAPKVTVWLKETPPIWANTATRRTFKFSPHRANYNGDPTMAVIDVREF